MSEQYSSDTFEISGLKSRPVTYLVMLGKVFFDLKREVMSRTPAGVMFLCISQEQNNGGEIMNGQTSLEGEKVVL